MHYKERDPLDTIRLASDCLLRSGIFVYENWYATINKIFSVTLHIDGTNFIVNGKGVSRELALASAYGELMERIQNLAFFRIGSGFCPRAYYEPLGRNTILVEHNPGYFSSCIDIWLEGLSKINSSLIRNTFESVYSIAKSKMCYMVYCDISDNGSKLVLPYPIIDCYYGTNGMSAGNSLDEALVQALSEILERYVLYRIIKGDITPPNLNYSILDRGEEFVSYVKQIESSGRYKVIIKDMSLDMGIPAAGLILVDVPSSRYFVKAGVHPVIDIAVERCFTELFQGRELNDHDGFSRLGAPNLDLREDQLFYSVFRDGRGNYPASLLYHTPTYESENLKTIHYSGNIEMREYLTNLITSMGFRAFFADETYSPINAIHVIVPGMSEVTPLNSYGFLEELVEDSRLYHIAMTGLNNASEEDLALVKKIIQKEPSQPETTLSRLVALPSYLKGSKYLQIDCSLILIAMSIINSDYIGAYKVIKSYNAQKKNISTNLIALEVALGYRVADLSLPEIELIMNNFYDCNIVLYVVSALQHPFKQLVGLECLRDCHSCQFKKECTMEGEGIFFNNVKKLIETGKTKRRGDE